MNEIKTILEKKYQLNVTFTHGNKGIMANDMQDNIAIIVRPVGEKGHKVCVAAGAYAIILEDDNDYTGYSVSEVFDNIKDAAKYLRNNQTQIFLAIINDLSKENH